MKLYGDTYFQPKLLAATVPVKAKKEPVSYELDEMQIDIIYISNNSQFLQTRCSISFSFVNTGKRIY